MKIDRAYRKPNMPLNATLVYEGVIFDTYQWEQKLFDGSATTFEKLVRPDTAAIYPVLEDGRILLIEDTQPGQGTFLCSPMGRIDPEDVTPLEAAKRELLEETGYTIQTADLLYEVEPHIKIDWLVYGYIGYGAKKVQEPNPGAGEIITLHPVSFDELLDVASKENFDDPRFSILALQALANETKMKDLRAKFGLL
jgi:8-oxo-dGTP pyrophosphatase MutT (NUDIX family)